MKYNKVLITGGAGFIGSNLALKLYSLGYEVTVFDSLNTQIHGEDPEINSTLYKSILNKVNFIKGNVENFDEFFNAISNNEVVIHLAAETGTGQSMYKINNYVKTNILGTSNLVEILTNFKTQVSKVIIASSRSIYGEGKYYSKDLGILYPTERFVNNLNSGRFEVGYNTDGSSYELLPTDEDSKIHPSSIYGITKQNQEQLILTSCKAIGIDAISFRYQNVYGPGQSLKNPYTGILSIFSTQIKNNLPINIFEDGEESRDFVFIDDVVDATIFGINYSDENNNIFNVGSGSKTTVLEVANCLIKNYGINVPLNITGDYRKGDIRHNFADLTKIKKCLNYNPKFTFTEGIRLFSNWVNTQDVNESNYLNSLLEMKEKGLFKSK